MRSSIACKECRRSKIRCVHEGIKSVCRQCKKTKRKCVYETVPASASRRRRNSQDDTAQSRKQLRRQAASSPEQSPPHVDVLDILEANVLTPTIWLELFEIFQLHYAADLPFLHPTIFKKPLRKAANSTLTDSKPDSTRPPGCDAYLLSFLALTARFHPKLLAWQAADSESPLKAPAAISECCYNAASSILNRVYYANSGSSSLHQLQAMLMLVLYEWGSLKGARAWQRIGQAVRSAQAMGMQYDVDLDDQPDSHTTPMAPERRVISAGRRQPSVELSSEEDDFVMQEIRRRTFWSCFIMDRYMSSGKHRPHLLHVQELRIQLPANDQSFLFGEKATTAMLGESEAEFNQRINMQSDNMEASPQQSTSSLSKASSSISQGNPQNHSMQNIEVGANEGNISRFIRMINIYGRIVTWSCAGGRRRDKYAPWDQRSTWHNLERACHDFHVALPRQHTLSAQNIQAHIDQNTSGPYILIHVVWLFCQIVLHREYIPFIPTSCSKPQGPVDPPIFSPKDHNIPPGYWEDSARKVFQSAREIIDLIQICQECGHSLVQTPIMGFAVYTVAFVGVYSIQFPWMDPDGYMCTNRSTTGLDLQASSMRGSQATEKAVKVLGEMGTTLPMANGWSRIIARMYRYITNIKTEQTASRRDGVTNSAQRVDSSLSLRAGMPGGGLDRYKMLEKTLNEFGHIHEDEAITTTSTDGSDANSVASLLKSPDPMSRGEVEDSVLPITSEATESTAQRVAREAGSTLPSPISANPSFDRLPSASHPRSSSSPGKQPSPNEYVILQSSEHSTSTNSTLQVKSPEAASKQQYHPALTHFSSSQSQSNWYHPSQFSAPYNGMYQTDGSNEVMQQQMNPYEHPQNQAGLESAQMSNISSHPPTTLYQQVPVPHLQMWSPSYPWMPGVDLAAFTSGDEPADWGINPY